MRTVCSWSGGKDSCFALMKARERGYIPTVLLNVMNESGKVSRSHGLPEAILQAQSDAAGIPLRLVSSSWEDYEKNFTTTLAVLTQEYSLEAAVFGDIDLQAHRDWEEKVCAAAGLNALLPLWQQDREELVLQMLNSGIQTMIVSCNEQMGEAFLGRMLDKATIQELKSLQIDPCGENGEFHTLVLDCPLFSSSLRIDIASRLKHDGYWFAEPVLLS